MKYAEYVVRGYKPKKDELVCDYLVTPRKGTTFNEAAGAVAAESSIGTWSEISTMSKRVEKMAAKVFDLDAGNGHVKIAYPQQLFEAGNMPQILSSIAGNVFGMKQVDTLRLDDITFPKGIVDSFKGPVFGVDGLRKMLKVKTRPFCGTIVKPKIGLTAKEHAEVARECWLGGLDFVKDDENLSSLEFNKFKERVVRVLKARDQAEKETGERKAALLNVTAETNEMIRRAEFIKDHGGEIAMVDILTTGWAGLQTLRQANLKLAFHAHRAGHAMFDRLPFHGMSMLVLAKLARMIGVDTLHIGTCGLGKMHGSYAVEREIEDSLLCKWFDKKTVMPVASGGLHPGLVEGVVERMGLDVVIQAGGGVHGHAGGSRAGAKALRQAVEAAADGVPLRDAMEVLPELRQAIRQWGVK